jgi:hypothetical protein
MGRLSYCVLRRDRKGLYDKKKIISFVNMFNHCHFQGNYGKVYLGQLEDNQNHVVEVALKTFNLMPNAAIVKDLNREAGIMKVSEFNKFVDYT